MATKQRESRPGSVTVASQVRVTLGPPKSSDFLCDTPSDKIYDMYELEQIFTSGSWFAKKGREADFIKEWQAFADWAQENNLGSGNPYLLQDLNNPQHFISFGPWPTIEAIQTWRKTAQFKAFVEKVKNLCEKFEPFTLRVVAHGGSVTSA